MLTAAIGQYVISGLTTGSIYALIALGFTVVYNTCDIINFAQGEFAMFGGMLAVTFAAGLHLPLWAAVSLAIAATAVIGGAAALIAIYPLRRTSTLGLIILTIGLSIVMRGIAMMAWGKDYKFLPPFMDKPPIRVGAGASAVFIQWQAIWVLATAILIAAAMFLFFRATNSGRAMRACAVNRRGARICGIEPRQVMIAAFMLSAAIGAAGGAVIAPVSMTGYDIGVMLGLKGFCAAIIGGLTSLPGAVLGGLVLGLLEALTAGLLPQYVAHFKEILAFAALLGILYIQPSGLLGRRVP